MATLKMIKAPKKTKHFNKNQKLWIVELSGNQSAKVVGKFRGKNKYIKSKWIKWEDTDCIKIIGVNVSDVFYNKILGYA